MKKIRSLHEPEVRCIAKATNYEKQKARKYFRARAGIEPLIGHIKHDHRMIRNYLSGTQGDVINTPY